MSGSYPTRRPGLILALILALASTAIAAQWKEQVLYSFQGGSDGQLPVGAIVFDKQGNLYGTALGGNLVFQLAPPAQKGDPWTETLIYQFQNLPDGNDPNGGLIIDEAGNFYGVTAYGGSGGCILLGIKVGCGTVFEVSPPSQKGGQWTETILYSFQGGSDGYVPNGNLVFDKAGSLYGATTYGGGHGSCNSPYYQYCGTVFRLTPPKQKGGKWAEKVLYSFKGGTDGANPNGGLVLDHKGAVYGTTFSGGNQNCGLDGSVGCGTAFELHPKGPKGKGWEETQLHVFTDDDDGGLPSAGLTFGNSNVLYGVSLGRVFRLAHESGRWKKTNLYDFCNQSGGGCDPEGSLIFDSSGNLYGTTYYGFVNELRGSVFCLRRPKKKGGAWDIEYLHGFVKLPDGLYPAAGLTFDATGNLYSTTQQGGSGTGCHEGGCGTVFEVSPP